MHLWYNNNKNIKQTIIKATKKKLCLNLSVNYRLISCLINILHIYLFK